MPHDLWARIEDYRFDNRPKIESDAMRYHLEKGLEAVEGKAKRK